MTESELKAFIERLGTIAPSSRASEKRRLLESNGDAINALHRRGHSWSSIARELSAATGERISADLLRAACVKRAPQRRTPSVKGADAKAAPKAASFAAQPLQATPAPAADRFGSKGLKL